MLKKGFIYPWVFDEGQDFGWSNQAAIESYDDMARTAPEVERQRLQELGVSSEDVLMDIGCGTGTLVLEAAKICKKVIALDVSKLMIDHLKKEAQQLDIDNIDYVTQGFLSYEHSQDSIDFVVSQHTFHHLPDLWKAQALQGIYDILKPDGILFLRDVMFSFEPSETENALEHWMTSVAVESGRGFPKTFFEQQVREEFYTYTWLFEPMLEKVGFQIKDVNYGNFGAYATYICAKQVAA